MTARQKATRNNHDDAFHSIVHNGTSRFDAPTSPSRGVGLKPLLLHERLHELSPARSSHRRGPLPDLRVRSPHPLT
jgi:hypothetical protein